MVVLWCVCDQAVKAYMEAQTPSTALVPVIDGVVGFRLVHNFGAAWGSFSGMVIMIAVVSIVLCAIILAYTIYIAKEASVLETVGLALIFAGGVGNMIDRLLRGYVVDFIEPLFIDFPNFNIADAGITCGIICVLIAFIIKFLAVPKHVEHSE